MGVKRYFIIIVSMLSLTCISCAHNDYFEDEEIILENDSINNRNQIPDNDSINNNGTHNNATNPNDSVTTNTSQTEIESYNIDTLFTDSVPQVSISGFSKYMNQTGGGNVQGAAAYGDYLFQFQDHNAAVLIYNLAKKCFIKKITLTPNNNNHCNQASFSDIFYEEKDIFPLLYVSGSSQGTYSHVQVYRITFEEDSIEIGQIQEIILPKKTNDNWVSYTCSIIDNENHYLYAYASNASTRIIKFNIPDFHQETVKLYDNDILDFTLLEHIDHQQGGIIRNGIFYMIFGVPGWGDTVWLRLFNLETKTEIARYNLSEKDFKGEPESIFFYNNELYAVTNNAGIFKIILKKTE